MLRILKNLSYKTKHEHRNRKFRWYYAWNFVSLQKLGSHPRNLWGYWNYSRNLETGSNEQNVVSKRPKKGVSSYQFVGKSSKWKWFFDITRRGSRRCWNGKRTHINCHNFSKTLSRTSWGDGSLWDPDWKREESS